MLLAAAVLLAAMPDWVPARWSSNDPKTIDLIAQTPINCVLLEQPQWSEPFALAAARRGIATLGVVRPSAGDPVEAGRKAIATKLSGVVLEGIFEPAVVTRVRGVLADSKIPMIELTTRGRMRLDSGEPVIGSFQGVWPGIEVQDDKTAKAAPSGSPWIDTNTGFLRFAKAATESVVWIANIPPEKREMNIERYLHAIGDAGMTGARWVVALKEDFQQKLIARDPEALKNWQIIGQHLKYYEDHKEWRTLQARATLAVVEDADSGALLSGGVLDMIAVKHTPVRPVPNPKLTGQALTGSKMAVDVDPASLSENQKEFLKSFMRNGGTLLTGPPGWKFPSLRKDQIVLGKEDLTKLDEIWKELNSMTGRRNLGARLFNVSSMLSNLLETPDGKKVVLHLVNYGDWTVEDVTVHLLGTFKSAKLYRPEGPPIDLTMYPVDEGTGIDIAKVGNIATIVLE